MHQYGGIGSWSAIYLILKKSLNRSFYTAVKSLHVVLSLSFASAIERTCILEGLAVARSNIDEMIAIIRNSKNREEAATAISSRSWTLHSDIINLLDVSARLMI